MKSSDDPAAGLTSFIHLLNPEMAVIGGGASEQTSADRNPAGRVLACRMPRLRESLRIEKADPLSKAGVICAVRFLPDRYPELEQG